MEVICLQEEAFLALFKKVIEHVEAKRKDIPDKWIGTEEAMHLLRIKSTTTLQKLRDEGKIRYTQPQRKIILYDRESLNDYLESHARQPF